MRTSGKNYWLKARMSEFRLPRSAASSPYSTSSVSATEPCLSINYLNHYICHPLENACHLDRLLSIHPKNAQSPSKSVAYPNAGAQLNSPIQCHLVNHITYSRESLAHQMQSISVLYNLFVLNEGLGGPVPLLARRSLSKVPGGPPIFVL